MRPHGVIILVYQCNNGISRSDGTFVSMLELGYRDGRESVSNTLIQSLHRDRRQSLLFFAYRSIHRLEKLEVSGGQSWFLFETHAYLTTLGKFVILLSSYMIFCESFSILSRTLSTNSSN